MSIPEGTRPRWPLRSIGLALLGLAAAAAVVGVVLAVSGGGAIGAGERRPATSDQDPSSAQPSPSAVPPPRPPQSPTRTPVPTPSTSPVPAPVAPAPAGPATTDPRTDSDPVGSGKGDRRGELRIYNNSTVRGLATRAADDFTAAGWTVVEVDNYPGGRIPTSTVYYREGTDERASAEALGAEFGMRVEPRFAGIADARPGVIVIVTNDYGS